jgi:hypothetical protein
MDNTEFNERLDKIANGLGKLRSELYKATKPGTTESTRSDVMKRARTRLKEYEDFLPILSEGRRSEATDLCNDNIEGIRGYLNTLEKVK